MYNYFLKRYLQEEQNQDELNKSLINRSEEELEDRKESYDIDEELNLCKKHEEELSIKERVKQLVTKENFFYQNVL